MRIPHWLKENKRDRVYKRYLFVDTETEGQPVDDIRTRHVFKIACTIYVEFRTQDDILMERYSEEEKVFFSSSELFDYLESKIRSASTLVVVAHNWRFDFVALNAYDELIRRGFECRNFICESAVFYASFTRGTRRVIFLDSTNIFKVPLAELGKVIGIEKMGMPKPEEGIEKLIDYCMNDVRILAKAFLLYVRFLRENNLGDMKLTIAAQSFAAFRHRFMGNAIYIHNSERALNLEREAYFGGRNECFHIGRIDNPTYKLDVNSMYPYVMKTYEYPYKFVAYLQNIDVEYLRKLTSEYCVIAHVLLNTPENAFPKRLNGKLIFPVGRFDTFLCTPELVYAIEKGCVRKVYSAAVYRKARIFHEYVEFFYRKRMEYKEQGNTAFAAIAKLFLNSLYGKFGQRGERWVEVGEDKSGTAFAEWYEIDIHTGEKRRMRSLFGKVYVHVRESESFNSFPAIAAHVTSYARMRLWEIMKKAGVENVFYCDTDSVFVDEEGYRNLCRYQEIDDKELGKLKLEGAYRWMVLRGCKDYVLEGDEEKIKGIRKNAEKISENTYIQEQFRNPIQCYKIGFFDTPIVEKTMKVLRRKYEKGVVTSSGAVVPFRLTLLPLSFLTEFLRWLSLSR
jgi:hypothetical protein